MLLIQSSATSNNSIVTIGRAFFSVNTPKKVVLTVKNRKIMETKTQQTPLSFLKDQIGNQIAIYTKWHQIYIGHLQKLDEHFNLLTTNTFEVKNLIPVFIGKVLVRYNNVKLISLFVPKVVEGEKIFELNFQEI